MIPVYNDTQRLQECIKTLQKQTYPKECFEIVIIDNGSEDDISVIGNYPNVHLGYEIQPGSFAARNKGILVSRGDIFAFMDSDCLSSPDWLKYGVEALLKNKKCGIVGGAINFFFKKDKPNIIELYDSLFFLQQERYVKEINIAVTANLFTFKKLFYKVGFFDSKLKSGGDGEWCKRVFDNGYKLTYSVDAMVKHPARDNIKDLYRKIRRITGGKFLREKRVNEDFLFFWKTNLAEFFFGINKIFKLKDIVLYKKIQLFFLEFSIQCLRMYELLKLKNGKISERT